MARGLPQQWSPPPAPGANHQSPPPPPPQAPSTSPQASRSRPNIPNQPSVIGLRRLNTASSLTRHGRQNNSHTQPPVRSMLDIDGNDNNNNNDTHDPRTQAPIRSMLDVDDSNHASLPPSAAAAAPHPRGRRQHSLLRVPFRHRNRTQDSLAPTDSNGSNTAPGLLNVDSDDPSLAQPGPGNKHRLGRFGRRRVSRSGTSAHQDDASAGPQYEDYDQRIVSMLDVVDPEVATLSSITNVQNSLFVPSLGRWINRRPTYDLTPMGSRYSYDARSKRAASPDRASDTASLHSAAPTAATDFATNEGTIATLPEVPEDKPLPERPGVERIPSNLTERFYAVRPHDTSLADWSDEDLALLDDHVRHMMHSRRSAFHRRMKAFRQYVKRPLGFLVTLYAFLITVFGLAWVLFLIGWISVGDAERRNYLIDVIDQVLVALFAVVGDGMIPWRAVDTYHMIYIAHYHHLTWDTRKKLDAPKLKNKNDLPSETVDQESDAIADLQDTPPTPDLEAARELHNKEELSVLTPEQQRKLEHHQAKFAKSHTFYKPHETETHYAFPLRLLVAIVVLLDFHSCFQLALGFSTWLIPYKVRPGALTATLLTCSICINCTAGILISIGDRRTRKKDVVERMFRQELTKEAMRRVEEAKEKQAADELEAEKKQKKESLLKRIDELEKLRTSLDEPRGSGVGSSSRKSLEAVGKFNSTMSPSRERGEPIPESPGESPAEEKEDPLVNAERAKKGKM